MTQAPRVNIRSLSIKCGACDQYQTLCRFEPGDDLHVYVYECENEMCDPDITRTLVEVPVELDDFARRDPAWRGGGRHGATGPDVEVPAAEVGGSEDDDGAPEPNG